MELEENVRWSNSVFYPWKVHHYLMVHVSSSIRKLYSLSSSAIYFLATSIQSWAVLQWKPRASLKEVCALYKWVFYYIYLIQLKFFFTLWGIVWRRNYFSQMEFFYLCGVCECACTYGILCRHHDTCALVLLKWVF